MIEAGDLARLRVAVTTTGALESRNAIGWTPLIKAVSEDRHEIVSFLVDAGADRGARDDLDLTALDHAVSDARSKAMIDRLTR
ncbi:ankyrin repeat domain-containing protein [Rubrimonas cliftonensis]|nr:ankyrin repeat domain-containing protein [Rubrimonas cliftonensis]